MENNCDNRPYSCVNIPNWIFMIDDIATNINKNLTIIKNCLLQQIARTYVFYDSVIFNFF